MDSSERRDPITAGTGSAERRFWVNVDTGEVEEGRQSGAAHRIGPYDTREEAERAFDKAAQRNESWDEEDRRWNDDDWPDSAGGSAVP
jgi:hypothetical protein